MTPPKFQKNNRPPPQLDTADRAVLDMLRKDVAPRKSASSLNREPTVNKKIQDSRESRNDSESQSNKKTQQGGGEASVAREARSSRAEEILEKTSQSRFDSSQQENKKALMEQRKKNTQQNNNTRTWRIAESRELNKKARKVIKLAEEQKSQQQKTVTNKTTHKATDQSKASQTNSEKAVTQNQNNQNNSIVKDKPNIAQERPLENKQAQLKLVYSQSKNPLPNEKNNSFSQRLETPKRILNYLDTLTKQKINTQKNQSNQLQAKVAQQKQLIATARIVNQSTVIIREGHKIRLFQRDKDHRNELKEQHSDDSSEGQRCFN